MSPRAIIAGTVLVGLLGACAARQSRLTSRVVEDPIVMQGGTGSLAISQSERWYQATDADKSSSLLNLRIGLTDRLELDQLMSLRYAILDDAPTSCGLRAPLSLSVQAGSRGFGFGGVQGLILLPIAGVAAVKHVADRWRLSLSTTWTALWVETPQAVSSTYDDGLIPLADRQSSFVVDASAARQLTERFAASVGVALFQSQGCVAPFCSWSARGASTWLALSFRPRRWLTLVAGPGTGFRYRPLVLEQPQSPVLPVSTPPRSVSWVDVTGTAILYW